MAWEVLFHEKFFPEFRNLPEEIQDELLARCRVIGEFGPNLGRPNVDTLQGSKFSHMKELRFQWDGVWRFAFAFDLLRNAVVLCGGDKENKKSKRFYRELIETADERFDAYIANQRKTMKKAAKE